MNHFGVPTGIPGRPPMMPPGMPPFMPPGFRPMGGPPMMGHPMMPMMPHPSGVPYKPMVPPSVIAAPPALNSNSVSSNFQGPTVYVGKIPISVEDEFVKKMLDQCGKNSWRRVNDPVTGKPKGFGFCDFENPEGALRALKGLSALKIDGGELLLKVDDKTQQKIDEYSVKKTKPTENGVEVPDTEEANTREAIKQLMYKRDKGDDYKNFVFDPTKVRDEKNYRDKEENEEERLEKERRKQAEKERERERELRRKEKEERDYRDREKAWETREYNKQKDREREMEKEKREREREPRDILYDDTERKKRSREYEKRKRELEKEKQEDDTDRIKEYEEQEEERIREEVKRKEEEERLRKQIIPEKDLKDLMSIDSPTAEDKELDRTKVGSMVIPQQTKEKKAPITVVPGFNAEPEIDELYIKKKRKLVTLDSALHEEVDRKAKLEQFKTIIETIPTTKELIFPYSIQWEIVDEFNLVEKKMRTWVTKKIVEYLGEEEKTLINFILSKLTAHTSPHEILDQIQLVLDEEAEVFLVKMWRMLIFEMLQAKQLKEDQKEEQMEEQEVVL